MEKQKCYDQLKKNIDNIFNQELSKGSLSVSSNGKEEIIIENELKEKIEKIYDDLADIALKNEILTSHLQNLIHICKMKTFTKLSMQNKEKIKIQLKNIDKILEIVEKQSIKETISKKDKTKQLLEESMDSVMINVEMIEELKDFIKKEINQILCAMKKEVKRKKCGQCTKICNQVKEDTQVCCRNKLDFSFYKQIYKLLDDADESTKQKILSEFESYVGNLHQKNSHNAFVEKYKSQVFIKAFHTTNNGNYRNFGGTPRANAR